MYIGRKFKTNDTIFERLERVNINIKEEDRYYKYVSTYDYEAIQEPDDQTIKGRKMHYVHIPATFSVCSNVPGHTEPIHKVSRTVIPQNLVDEMVKLQLQHQAVASESMRTKFQWVFNSLTKGKEFYGELVKSKNKRTLNVMKI